MRYRLYTNWGNGNFDTVEEFGSREEAMDWMAALPAHSRTAATFRLVGENDAGRIETLLVRVTLGSHVH